MKPPNPISARVNNSKGFEPLDVNLTVTIPKNEMNRSVCVGWTNLDTLAERFSCQTIEGMNEQVSHLYSYHLSAGRYVMVAQLEQANLKTFGAQVNVEVLSTN